MMRQIPLPLPHDQSMGIDDFLVTPSNQEAVSWIEKWPEWPTHGLILTGLSGSGKTHLLNLWLEKTGGKLVSSAELIAQDSVTLTSATVCLALDDCDSIAAYHAAEEKLFHLFNHLKTVKGSLLLTMNKAAGQVGFLLPDLRSRLLTLPVASLKAPDDTLLAALIVKQFRDRQVTLDAGVVAYLVPRAMRDAAGIRDLVEKLDHAALAEGRKITVSLARKVLEGDNA
jgi:DnaA regulatory inactivator Hda